MTTYIIFVGITLLILVALINIKPTIFDSEIQENNYIGVELLFLAIIFPYTWVKLFQLKQLSTKQLKLKMSKRTVKRLAIVLLVIIGCYTGTKELTQTHNKEVTIVNKFNKQTSERNTLFDMMYKTITQKTEIAFMNDSSFRKNITIIMDNRKDGEQIMWKWLQEINPNANYQEVSALYKDLSGYIALQRDRLFQIEKSMQNLKLEHDNLRRLFPTNISMYLLSREELEYKPFLNEYTLKSIKEGQENNLKLFK